MLVLLDTIDDVVSESELARWQGLVQTGQQSTAVPLELVAGELYDLVRRHVPSAWPLLHCLVFDITNGCETEMHRDVGEYAVLFFPFCSSAPLRTDRGDVAVRSNRLVLLDCTQVAHQQVVPMDASHRYSVAFKFKRLEVG